MTADVMDQFVGYKDKLTACHAELEDLLKACGKVLANELPDMHRNIVTLNTEIQWYVLANATISLWETLVDKEHNKLSKK